MLLTVVGAVTVATVIVLAAHAARDRRALLSELHALREEVRDLAARVVPAATEEEAPPLSEARALPASRPDVAAPGETASAPGDVSDDQPGRGPKTVH